MGDVQSAETGLPIVAVISRYDEGLAWARERCRAGWGSVALESRPFDFVETDYYTATMGPDLKKMFLVLAQPQDVSGLADWKRSTNGWEAEYARECSHPEPRPLNLDPGYLTLSKLVLASTKNHAHRIYLREGIYAELTLQFRRGVWQELPWTYPDYRRADFHQFFGQARQYLQRLARQVVDWNQDPSPDDAAGSSPQ